MESQVKRIYLVRHCQDEPSDNLDQEKAAHVPLTSLGRLQARSLGRYLKRRKIEAVYTSVYQRSKETASIIHSYTGGVLIVDERLNEQSLARAKLDKFAAKEIKRRMLADPLHVPEGGQSLQQSIGLFLESLDEISRSSFERVCVVTHGFLMQAAVQRKFKLLKSPELPEGSVTVIEYVNGEFTLKKIGVQPFIGVRAYLKLMHILRVRAWILPVLKRK